MRLKKKLLFIAFCFSQLTYCQPAVDSNKVTRVLLINAIERDATGARKKKQELFSELADSLQQYLAGYYRSNPVYEVALIPSNFVMSAGKDSLVSSLMKANNAGLAIFVRSLDVFFENAGESVDKDAEGKRKKTIRYDLCTNIGYSVYNGPGRKDEVTVRDCEFFTDRTSSGTFSVQFGPDIVGKRKHTYKAVKRNAEKFFYEQQEGGQK